MAQQTINVGTSPNDGTGTPLRTAFQYTNSNFSELYTAVGPSGNNIVVPGTATITGDLTVRTNQLKVDSVGVGIGTTDTSTGKLCVNTGDGTVCFRNFSLILGSGTGAGLDFLNSARSAVVDGGMRATNLTLNSFGANPLILLTDSTERYRISSTGVATWSNVGGVAGTAMTLNSTGLGVGVTPSAWLASSYKAIQVNTTGVLASFGSGSNQSTRLANNWFSNASGVDTYITSNFATVYQQSSGQHLWYTAASGTAGNAITFTQAMTLDASGNLLVGSATVTAQGRQEITFDGSVAQGLNIIDSGSATTSTAVSFIKSAGTRGNILVTATGTTFNTVSDYRLKEFVQPLIGGLIRINALKPSIYKWKTDGSAGEGFLAHELAEVVPAAVNGEKDAVNEDGTIKAQSVDMSRIVPILVAAIKELSAEVNALKNA